MFCLGERHATTDRNILGRAETQSHQDASGAEEAQGEHIGLLFGFRLLAKFSDVCEFGVGGCVTEEYMSKFMGYGKARDYGIIQIVVYDYPLFAVVVCLCVLARQEFINATILNYADLSGSRDLQHVDGEAINIIIKEAEPCAVSYILIGSVKHEDVENYRRSSSVSGVVVMVSHLSLGIWVISGLWFSADLAAV